jgi:hypothetical protein
MRKVEVIYNKVNVDEHDSLSYRKVYRVGARYVTPQEDDEFINVKSEEELRAEFLAKKEIEDSIRAVNKANSAIQNLLDTTAQTYRYDNMMSARSYTGYVNPFQIEAQSLAVWASSCWVKAGEIEADVLAGIRPIPTADELLAEMPIYIGV